MTRYIKLFEAFLRESFNLQDPTTWPWSEEETPEWSTLKEMLEEVEADSPEAEAAEFLLRDCGCKAEEVYYEGALDHGHALQGTKVVSPAGYPGAITLEKIELPGATYYLLHGYDADHVFRLNRK